MHPRSELMVQIKQKGVYGVENPLPKSLFGGEQDIVSFSSVACLLVPTHMYTHIFKQASQCDSSLQRPVSCSFCLDVTGETPC